MPTLRSSTGARLTDVAGEHGTPAYLIDEADFRARAAAFRDAFPGWSVYYAGKAFLTTDMARWVTEAGLRIDVASGGELAVALAAGVDARRLGLHGTNKSDAAATVRALLADLEAGQLPAPSGPDAAEVLAGRGRAASTFADWERIDAAEQAAGERFGRPRVKVATWHALTDLVRHGRPGGPLEHEGDPA